MKNYLILICVISSIIVSAADEEKIYKLKKTNTEIEVDGIIDSLWETADSLSDFIQHSPYNGKEPTIRTVTKLLTTDESIYGLIVCYDSRSKIQNVTGTLDQFSGDMVSLMFDTFNDHNTAYKFAVSASGVRSDCRLIDDARNRDYSWDGIWFADSKIYDWGFVVEMKIPYKSIQYDTLKHSWGLDIDRWSPVRSEDIYWCGYEENEGQRISKFGSLVFEDFTPQVEGLNLEIYPVALTKFTYIRDGVYEGDPALGIDIFYNPSRSLTFQLTANPDFAQIEADPFDFNISRYESYYSERRPFFTQGYEIFRPSGQERSSGFYLPLELFYSRRIGKILPDGTEVPLTFGAKASGRINEWEYGGFVARTAETDYEVDGNTYTEPKAFFGTGRIKKQVLGNSSIGILFSGKQTSEHNYGVIDVDGAFRSSDWQLAYQVARSFKDSTGDYAASAGFRMVTENWMTLMRSRYIGDEFDINQIGYVPWIGTGSSTILTGPRWYFTRGELSSILLYAGPYVGYEKVDDYIDKEGIIGFNMQFRSNWAYEINISAGKNKDQGKEFDSYELNLSAYFNIKPEWSANIYGGVSKSYNFSRDYLALFYWLGGSASWKIIDILEIGSSLDTYVEGNPEGNIEDVTFNSRPYFSLTPVNYLNLRMYVDNVYVRSTDKLEQLVIGFLFSYNFSPKSWIYFAINELHTRETDPVDNIRKMEISDRAAVLKIKYLYYF